MIKFNALPTTLQGSMTYGYYETTQDAMPVYPHVTLGGAALP